jgi:hypothetical protein
MTTLRKKLITRLAEILDVELPVSETIVPAPPIEYVATLEDDPRHIYVWVMRPDASDNTMAAIAEDLSRRNLKSLHLFVRDIADVRRMEFGEVKQYLVPVIESYTEAGWL